MSSCKLARSRRADPARKGAHPVSNERERRALVVCYSNLEFDPRVTRQIDWLATEGWVVDSLGLGAKPTPEIHRHFAFRPAPAYTRTAAAKAAIHALLPHSARFKVLVESQIPRELLRDRPRDGYDLILVNDIDLLPWVTKQAPALASTTGDAVIHLDVHEFHTWAPETDMPRYQRRLLENYHSWLRNHISSPVFTSRSTVADGIADLYAAEFGVERPSIVRNSPAFVEQDPSPVDPDAIALVYHGNAEMARGLDLLIEGFRKMEERFTLTLMLTGSVEGKQTLAELTRDLSDRVTFIDPVPMSEVAERINAFDLEVIFYPPTSPNFLHSFPNKFFESVQGRLAVVVGQSPSMTAIVSRFGNGVVVDGWTSDDLAGAVNALTAEQIETMKRASAACAVELNSDAEKERFLAGLIARTRR
jgi:glycosyltransferase involved in cell wall biosynthesis